MDSIKFPMQFTSGGLSRVAEESDEYYRQLLAISALTEPNSLPLTPDFGIWDPTFSTVEKGQFVLHSSRFVPEVEIEEVDVSINDEGESVVSFAYRRR
jgi:hypothetical protein